MNHEEMMKHIALPEGFEKPKMRGDIDGNAFSVLGNTKAALKKAGHADIAKRLSEVALQGDYNALLAACSSCVEFVFPEYDFEEEDEEEDARYFEND
jgi:hypothetical protein